MLFNTAFGVQCCIGEAKKPGPSTADAEASWTLGVCNPSGLPGKSTLLAGVSADVIAVSETHLTSSARSILQHSLKSHSDYKYVVTGAPLAPRSHASGAGHYSGVATVSKVPCRALCAHWPQDMYDTGRVMVSGALVNNTWITGATIYGYPQGKTHPNAFNRTVACLDAAFDHMTQVATGPRYLCGDWNFEPRQLEVCQRLQALGWREVQDLQFLRTGQPPQLTCKQSTRKDFLWVSPELVDYFVQVEIDSNRFPDHVVLRAKFRLPVGFSVRYLWPVPHAVPWNQVDDLSEPLDFLAEDPTVQYQTLWHTKEALAAKCLGDKWTSNMAGRGQRLAPAKRCGWAAPPKKGRSCDAQPNFHGYNVHHARWLKQLRRLQNYANWAASHHGQGNSHASLHGLLLWRSILHATGFGTSFCKWWLGRRTVGFHDPVFVPVFPPQYSVAVQLWETFQCEVHALERALLAAKQSARRCQHQTNPNLIFQDTRRPSPEPVTTLLVTNKSRVVEVEPDDVAVVIDPPMAFDETKPVLLGTIPVGIIHATDTKLFLEDVGQADVGMSVSQSSPVGELDLVFEAFHEQWRRRWCRHDQTPHSRWDQLVGFARHVLPHHPVACPTITAELLRAEVAHKKPKSAAGLDGVTRQDLLQVDLRVLDSLCSLYIRAGTDGQWPQQVLAGRVASLAKTAHPEQTNDYRPITVFSLVYWIFSSLRARFLLDWADSWCHQDIYGNRKCHQTTHLWRTLVTQIQTAHDQGQVLSGLTADIEKCFNCLPRWPILAAAVFAGVPPDILQAWAGALASMVRHFKVRESFSSGFTTSTGLAEGCALSCFGMLLLDDVMHRYTAAQYPMLRVLSFVDNWDFVTTSNQAALRQLDALLDFAALADLTVDRKKTFAWSTCAVVRKQLREAGLPVRHYAKDLGAHFGFTRQRTNRTVTSRLDDLQPLWLKLRSSRAGYQAKLRALRTVAWPRGLFAVESAPIAHSTWLTQRRQAVKALHFDKPGVNPLVLLGLVEAYADPQLLALLRSVSEARLNCSDAFWTCELFSAAVGALDSPPTSPVSVLLERVQSVGLTVLESGCWRDGLGSFHPALLNYTELCHRLQWQWNQYVADQVGYRKDFGGLRYVDVALTRHALSALSPDNQALLRVSLAGGLFTQDAHSHWNETVNACKWCGATDSLQHRYFECAHTLDLRQSLAPDVVEHRATLPDAMVLRSWAILPPTHRAWLALLDSVPSTVPAPWTSLSSGWNHVFTDGSCLWQSEPALRVASWAALVATPFAPSWTFTCQGLLGSGWLPGLCQSAFRSELYALAFVLHHASAGGFWVKIYCDCLGVINKYHLLTQGRVSLRVNSANGDLWRWVLDSTCRLGLDKIRLVKIPAHKKIALAKTRQEAWMTWNNNAVDQAARLVNVNRPLQFWTQWQQHACNVFAVRKIYKQVIDLHLAVAQRSVLDETERTLDDHSVSAPRQTREFQMVFDTGLWTGDVPGPFAAEYGGGIAGRIVTWWKARTQAEHRGSLQWVTLAHLYIDYQLTWGCPGPIKHGKLWLDATLRPFLDPEKFDFLVRLKWFKRCLKYFWRTSKQRIGLEQCRGTGDSIQSYVASASVRWDSTTWEASELWLFQNCKGPVARGTRALQRLPLAKANQRWALKVETPNGVRGRNTA